MNNHELVDSLVALPKETEWVEFKENKANPEEIGENISALANSAGLLGLKQAYLVFGIHDITHKIVGTKFKPSETKVGNEELENWLASSLRPYGDFKIVEFEYIKDVRLVLIQIDACKNTPIRFKNEAFIRVGSYTKPLKNYPEKERKIWSSTYEEDWSALATPGALIEDIDPKAITFMRKILGDITRDSRYDSMSDYQLLNALQLLEKDVPNNTCIILLGKEDSAQRLLGDKAKIHWKYEDSKNNIVERKDFYAPYILSIEELKTNINRFNTNLEDLTLFRQDIKQYNEKAVEELLVNSIVHRDWTINLWSEIIQSPLKVSFKNPGVFRANLELALKNNLRPEYLNPRLAGIFKRINLMEQEGGGLRKVYEAQLRKGIRVTSMLFTDAKPPFVQFTLVGKIENYNFAKLVLAKSDIEFSDLLLLDKIVSGINLTPTEISKEDAKRLKDLGYIEISPGRTRRCNISLNFSFSTETG
jgi:ATP-dependent DNA helicase RecG